eukprot:SAG31_NODE_2819_length_5041_cov_10.089235_2_plen_60_part_00
MGVPLHAIRFRVPIVVAFLIATATVVLVQTCTSGVQLGDSALGKMMPGSTYEQTSRRRM